MSRSPHRMKSNSLLPPGRCSKRISPEKPRSVNSMISPGFPPLRSTYWPIA